MNEENLIRSANRARRLQDAMGGEDGLGAVFDAIHEGYVRDWLGTISSETSAREMLFCKAQALRDLRSAIETAIAEGAGASVMIAAIRKR